MTNREIQEISCILEAVREQKPIVHHITNYVTVNDCANVTLAIGASPIMADALEEIDDIGSISSSLVINIGTLNERTVKSMLLAGQKANERCIPVILDPVGAGASALRNQTVEKLLQEVKITVLRGNMSEIGFIAGVQKGARGVDAAHNKDSLENSAAMVQEFAQKLNCVVAATGAIDILSDGQRMFYIKNGQAVLGGITGTGCMCTSLIASFCGAGKDYLSAAAGGLLCMGIAADLAWPKTQKAGLGSLRMAIIDELSHMQSGTIEQYANIVIPLQTD
ncbi:MAG: hydroxyethylthiazole kinase [Chloroflexi bacterium]|nr:hydroxyethylthiazole kinase [Chloroflexota bacterium]